MKEKCFYWSKSKKQLSQIFVIESSLESLRKSAWGYLAAIVVEPVLQYWVQQRLKTEHLVRTKIEEWELDYVLMPCIQSKVILLYLNECKIQLFFEHFKISRWVRTDSEWETIDFISTSEAVYKCTVYITVRWEEWFQIQNTSFNHVNIIQFYLFLP